MQSGERERTSCGVRGAGAKKLFSKMKCALSSRVVSTAVVEQPLKFQLGAGRDERRRDRTALLDEVA